MLALMAKGRVLLLITPSYDSDIDGPGATMAPTLYKEVVDNFFNITALLQQAFVWQLSPSHYDWFAAS